MGNTKIRRFIHSKSKWVDKSAKKHKHIFEEKVLIHLYGDPNKHIGHSYYIADKCKLCDSFINAEYTKAKHDLPVLTFYKPHFSIDFSDIKKVDEEDTLHLTDDQRGNRSN